MEEHELRAKWLESFVTWKRDWEKSILSLHRAHLRTQCRADAVLEQLTPAQQASAREREEELYQTRLLEIEDDVSAGLAAALDDVPPPDDGPLREDPDQPGQTRAD